MDGQPVLHSSKFVATFGLLAQKGTETQTLQSVCISNAWVTVIFGNGHASAEKNPTVEWQFSQFPEGAKVLLPLKRQMKQWHIPTESLQVSGMSQLTDCHSGGNIQAFVKLLKKRTQDSRVVCQLTRKRWYFTMCRYHFFTTIRAVFEERFLFFF